MGGEKDGNHNDIIRLRDSRIKRSAGKLSIESGYAKHPVVELLGMAPFLMQNGSVKRLPREAEWEIAARGERRMPFILPGMILKRAKQTSLAQILQL